MGVAPLSRAHYSAAMRKLAPLLLLVVSCKSAPEAKTGPATAAPPSPATPPATAGTNAGIDLTALDRRVSPCDDFYRFSCGGWLDRTPIPEDRPQWGRGFSEIQERNEAVLRDILEKDARGEADPADPYARKVGDFYATCMDESKAETASLATLRQELASIDAIQDGRALAREVADLHREGARPLFRFASREDFKDATKVIGGLDQSGLGLPDRDYYFRDDAKSKDLRALYVDHVGKMFQLAGLSDPAQTVMRIETDLARASMDRVSRRDPYKIYHPLDRKSVEAEAPHFDWTVYLAEVGAPQTQAFNVTAPDFFKAVDQLVAAGNLDGLRTYLHWRAIESAADTLGKAFVEERFRFTRALSGAKAILPRWKRCVEMTDRALGFALGRSFVAGTVGEQGKTAAREMIVDVEQAFARNLGDVSWMDEAARKASLEKLRKIDNKVAYPSNWRDYSTVQIGRESLLQNVVAAAGFETRRDLDKIGKPLDRTDWGMTPPTVNAYYNPPLNEMVFPAGIMQRPFFANEAPLATNFGGLGMVMGHELTHGFDDQGRKFDADGNLHEWWSPEVAKAFTERAECVAKQYDGYVTVDDVHLNGHLTLGENIADIGGLKMMISALRARGPSGEVGGFIPEQQAFIAFAQVWCTNYRPEQLRTRAYTDPHSSARWRVDGPVSDNPDFAKAFSCPAGAPMAPAQRCTVW
jgi:putative endopeptidase